MARHHLHHRGAALLCGAALLWAATPAARAWDTEWFDAQGRLVRVPVEGGWAPCKSELAVAANDWRAVAYLSGATNLQSVIGPSGAVWRADLALEPGVTCAVRQVAHAISNGVEIAATVTANVSNRCAGLFFILHLPAEYFAGGQATSGDQVLRLPEARAAPYIIGRLPGGAVVLQTPRENGAIRLTTPTNLTLLVQDNRRWSDEFACVVPLTDAPLAAGQTAGATLLATGVGRTRPPPLEIELDATQVRARFDGFGGNYCYALEGALARKVFASLRPAWGRAQMRLDELRRPRATRDAEAAFLQQLAAADQTNTELRAGLLFQQLLATNQVPCLLALWRAPAWMYLENEPQMAGNSVRPEAWDALAAAAVAYLRYARQQYAFEPEAFSINEPDFGAAIRVPSTNYPAIVRLFDAAFRRAGLKTRIVLGDVANPRDAALAYLEPALADPAALAGAVCLAFHTWGGATPDEYAAWAALADRLRLPLAVTEAGVDPDWRHAPVQRHDYAMAELAQYFAVLTWARPQTMLLWEHTDNYPILVRDADRRLCTTARWGFQKQWCAYTPRGSLYMGCDLPVGQQGGACAFRHGAGGAGFTLHIGNWTGARACRVSGLPSRLATLNMVRTTREQHAQAAGSVQPREGALRLELPAESMTTLTTLPLETTTE